MDKKSIAKASGLIVRDFELEPQAEGITEEEIFDLLAARIAYLIECRLEFLLSLMYRLDIDERKVHRALSPNAKEPANTGLARLVLERQKQRAFTKQYYKQDKTEDMDGLEY